MYKKPSYTSHFTIHHLPRFFLWWLGAASCKQSSLETSPSTAQFHRWWSAGHWLELATGTFQRDGTAGCLKWLPSGFIKHS